MEEESQGKVASEGMGHPKRDLGQGGVVPVQNRSRQDKVPSKNHMWARPCSQHLPDAAHVLSKER